MTTDATGSAPIEQFHQKLDWRRALRKHRERRRLSQGAVAQRAGLSLASVRAYETARAIRR